MRLYRVLLALQVGLYLVSAFGGVLAFQHGRMITRRERNCRRSRQGIEEEVKRERHAVSTTALQAMEQLDAIHIAGDAVAGLIGGSVGVFGTLVALDAKMKKVNERSKCPYCCGSGTLTCAHCYGGGTLQYINPDGVRVRECQCATCLGSGVITCINCKGDGLAIPVMLNKRTSRDPETRLEEYGLG